MFKRFIFLLLIPLFSVSCSKKEESIQEKSSILVTIPPYAYFAERIVGNTIAIQTLIPPGTNLHIYEPSPKSVEKNGKATVWFRIDEPIEQPIMAALKEQSPQMKMINLQEGLPLLSGALLSGDGAAIELTPCTSRHHCDRDLHTWLSPKLALMQAEKMARTLTALFPEHEELYQKNFNDLMLDMVKLKRDLKQELAPFKGRAILTSHPAFGYFCNDYCLIQLSVECEGKEPRPRDVENILKRAEEFGVRCVFLQQGFNNRGAQLIGKKLQLPNYRVDPYARDYLINMHKISGYIAK